MEKEKKHSSSEGNLFNNLSSLMTKLNDINQIRDSKSSLNITSSTGK